MPLFPGSPSTKRAIMVLSSDNEATGSSQTDFLMRIPFMLPVNTVQWRIKVFNPSSATPINVVGAYIGNPSYTSNNANFTGGATGLTQIASAGVTATNPIAGSTVWYSPWITAANMQLSPDVMKVLSIGFTLSGGTAYSLGLGPGVSYRGSGSSAQVGTNGTPSTGTFALQTPFLDIQIEYDFIGSNHVMLVCGDSLSVGNYDAPALPGNVPGPSTASWPGIAQQSERICCVNASIAGRTFATFNALTNAAFTRFDLVNCHPDILFLACGINEVNGGQSLSAYQAEIVSMLSIASQLGISRIILSTLLPQTRWKPGSLTAGIPAGSASISTTVPYANGDSISLDSLVSGTAETVTASGASIGNGPYTTTLTGTTANAHSIGALTGLSSEALRQSYNQWIRTWPPGITQLVDFDRAVAGFANDAAISVELGGLGSVHPGPAAYQRMAQAVRISG